MFFRCTRFHKSKTKISLAFIIFELRATFGMRAGSGCLVRTVAQENVQKAKDGGVDFEGCLRKTVSQFHSHLYSVGNSYFESSRNFGRMAARDSKMHSPEDVCDGPKAITTKKI